MNKLLVVSFIFLLMTQFIASTSQDVKNIALNENKEMFDLQEIFFNERFPNIVVATDGTLVATWGNNNYRVRRSKDGGQTWGEEISVSEPGFQGGGTIVDETTGNILIFVEEGYPISPLTVYRSKNNGKTWKLKKVTINPDINGNVPAMHMTERGTTLMHGEYAGRLIRPTRYYAAGNKKEYWSEHYTNAIYSDDRGKTWQTSQPFPANGIGEATLVELSDGTIYYNSRRHHSTDGLTPRKNIRHEVKTAVRLGKI